MISVAPSGWRWAVAPQFVKGIRRRPRRNDSPRLAPSAPPASLLALGICLVRRECHTALKKTTRSTLRDFGATALTRVSADEVEAWAEWLTVSPMIVERPTARPAGRSGPTGAILPLRSE
jgi:hypothetical protein